MAPNPYPQGLNQPRPRPTYPTMYFQWVRRDTEAPTRVLQQWWCFRYSDAVRLIVPEKCDGGGEWRDVPGA